MFKDITQLIEKRNEAVLNEDEELKKIYEFIKAKRAECAEFAQKYIQPWHSLELKVGCNFDSDTDDLRFWVSDRKDYNNIFYLSPKFKVFLSNTLSLDAQFALLKFLGYEPKELKMSKKHKEGGKDV